MKTYNVIGLMSGSSLDGVDVAYVHLTESNGSWNYQIEASECIQFPQKWKLRLMSLVLQNAVTYLKTDTYFGHYLGEVVKKFIDEHQLAGKVDFVASHGQTIFHQPENQMTSQIGDGASIAAECGLPVICNFRTIDVALGGQGTPIAPIADKLLFSNFRYCLNLGGIANVSIKRNDGSLVGFDICGANMVLNILSSEVDLDFDKDGGMASEGYVNEELLNDLNTQWYYEKTYPKSLGGGWVTKVFMPVFKKYRISTEDKLRTAVEHIATQIGKDLNAAMEREGISKSDADQMLITGGGAFNKVLIERIAAHSPVQVVVPDSTTIKFKEALLTALMGTLRLRGEINVLSSVTGAREDSIGGEIYLNTHKPLING
jgi:anhydro-N-acetylmuramic acid kinase